jgi:multicomponent Na+:H+ antiporter subunit B
MTLRARRNLFFLGALGFLALFLWGLNGLPGFGEYEGVYGLTLNRVAVAQRHATNLVAAVTFDYRGLDTLGE